VPRLASFKGVVVTMFFGDHPPPHVHVRNGRPGVRGTAKARFAIDSGALIDGVLPAAQASEVTSWCRRHRSELLFDWERAQRYRHPVGRYDS
jgi:uncharacterized protein DUF4160